MSDSGDAARRDRLKAALRDNLKRRKLQARGRSATVRSDAETARGKPEPTGSSGKTD